MSHKSQAGFTLITLAFGIVFFIAVVGLAVDIGRMYIAKSETQTYVDSASLAATLELDGTFAGLSRARIRAASNPNTWNFNTSSFSSTSIGFAKSKSGPWEENPVDPSGYRYARVVATVDVPIYFLSIFVNGTVNAGPNTAFIVVSSKFTASVNATSGSGQELKTRFREGLFPFSPYAHNTVGPDFGLVPGVWYTLRWAAHAQLNKNTCPGDNTPEMIALNDSGGGSERGYIEDNSASVIRKIIVDDYQSTWRGIGESVNMTGGAKQTELDALIERINQDTNSSAASYAEYSSSGTGNGRRIVAAPINSGHPNYIVVQIGAFFLLPYGSYDKGGNSAWCAEYLGAWVQGSSHKGAGDPGPYVVRLVQ